MPLRPIALLCLLAALVSLAGCAEGARFRGEIRADPSPLLELSWVRARRTDSGVSVRGQIRQVNCCAREILGHIRIRAIGATGATLSETDARWSEFIARQLHSAYFKARLPLPKRALVSRIEIQFETPQHL